MIFKNLLRRKGRTLLTVLGISIGVAAIIILGSLAEGLESGYNSMLTGSQADLVLSQPDTLDISLSSVDQEVGEQLAAMAEVSRVSPMLEGLVASEKLPYFFIFGYPVDSFALERFNVVEGVGLDSRQARTALGRPVLLGSAAAEALNKEVGDTVTFSSSTFRVVGIFETGEALEEGGALMALEDMQDLLGRQRKVSLFYIQLKDPELRERLAQRVERLWPDLSLSTASDFADKQLMGDAMRGYVWAIAGLAIIIGGVGMANAQLMSVFERTHEIGVLRALGWPSRRVMLLILGESFIVSLLGGVLGIGLGWLALLATEDVLSVFGGSVSNVGPDLLGQAFVTVMVLGLVGGVYPAWRASRLEPVEALRYEGGSAGGPARRPPVGGMAAQSLWRRTTRTLLTLTAIALTVGSLMAMEAMIGGAADQINEMVSGSGGEVMLRMANATDTSLSYFDQRIVDRVEALPQVESASGFVFTGVSMPETLFFIILGYAPNEFAIQRFNLVEGEPLQSNHQIIIGRSAAEALNKGPGDSLELGGSRFKIVGVYESGIGWEELGGVITLRDAQTFTGRPRKVTMASVKLQDPRDAQVVVEEINARYPEVHAALSGDFVDQLPDMEVTDAMLGAISFMTILVGGVGIMNTMLMAVLERTREIGALRALGWRRRSVLGLIMKEAMLLGGLGGLAGIVLSFALTGALKLAPFTEQALSPQWSPEVFIRAIVIALILGLIGGVYPALRATRMQPVEALRYE